MRFPLLVGAGLGLVTLALSSSPLQADTSPAGLRAVEFQWTPPIAVDPFGFGFDNFGTARHLSNGAIVTFDGQEIRRWNPSGTASTLLLDLGAPFFTGLMVIDPTETFVLVGQTGDLASLGGDVWRIALDGSGSTLLTTLPFNYDAAFEPGGTVLVSAAVGASSSVQRLDPGTGALTPLITVDGASGPVAVDPDGGDLYLGVLDPNFLPGETEILFFDAALLDGTPLDATDGSLFSSGWDGATSFAYDPLADALFLAENNFISGANAIYKVGPTKALSAVRVEGSPFRTIAALQLVLIHGSATLERFQPNDAGLLLYTSTDFFLALERRAVQPRRPTVALSGSGLTGAGPVTINYAGLDPLGSMMLFFGPQGLALPDEAVFQFGSLPPLFWSLDLGSQDSLPFALPVNASGQASFTFFNPGDLQGELAFQSLLFDGDGLLGTTPPAEF